MDFLKHHIKSYTDGWFIALALLCLAIVYIFLALIGKADAYEPGLDDET